MDSGRRMVFVLQRRDQPERRGLPVRVPGRDGRHDKRDRPHREDVLQLERPIGDARLRRRPGAGVPRRPLHGLAARPLVRRVDATTIWSATRWGSSTPRQTRGTAPTGPTSRLSTPPGGRTRVGPARRATRQQPIQAWEIVRDRGAHVSIANLIEMQMRHGMPPFQEALNHGILPSLSPDVETNMTTDPFSLMRGAFCLQRALANDLAFRESNPGELPVPQLVTSRQVIEMATIAGAAANRILDKVGTLTPGKEADIIVLDARNINTWPMNNVPGTIVTMMNPRHVRDVLIAGRSCTGRARSSDGTSNGCSARPSRRGTACSPGSTGRRKSARCRRATTASATLTGRTSSATAVTRGRTPRRPEYVLRP